MAESSHITYEQYLEAILVQATVEAAWKWNQNQIPGMPVKRTSAVEAGALPAPAAAKYIGVGKTKFYELVGKEIPEGSEIGGRAKWLKVDLDKYLAKQSRKRKGPT